MNTRNTEIQLNQVKVEDWDFGKIDADFDVYQVRLDTHSDRNILNTEDASVHILSTVYYSGRQCFVMTRKGQTDESALQYSLNKGIKDTKGKCFVRHIQMRSFRSLDEMRKMFGYRLRALVQLLINSTLNSAFPEDEYKNITGRCYYFNSSWNEDVSERIELIDLTLERDMVMFPALVTFVKEKPEGGKPVERVVLDRTSLSVRKALKGDPEESVYYRQGIDGTHGSRAYDGTTLAYWEKSRMACTARFFRVIKSRLTPYFNICFTRLMAKEASTSLLPLGKESVSDILKENGICLVDNVFRQEENLFEDKPKTNVSSWIEESVCAYREYISSECDRLGIPFKTGEKDLYRMNIEIVRNEKFYDIHKDLKDPYLPADNIVCQHITAPVSSRNAKGEYIKSFKEKVSTVMKELVIKADVHEGKIRLVDWRSYGFDKPVTFFSAKPCGTEQERKKGIRPVLFVGMTIQPDGTFCTESFRMANVKFPEWENSRQHDIIMCFFRENTANDGKYFDRMVELVFFEGDNTDQAYIIRRTNIRGMSNIEVMEKSFMDEKKDVHLDADAVLTAIECLQYDQNPGNVEVYYNLCSVLIGRDRILKSELLPLLYRSKKDDKDRVTICTKAKEAIANATDVVLKVGRRKEDSQRLGTDVYQHIHLWDSSEYDEEEGQENPPSPVVCYMVGQYDTPNQSITTSPVVRHILRADGEKPSEAVITKLLELMQVGFVRAKTYTVLPFPAKYLREVMNGIL